MARILIINGPNINLLGTREPAIYGTTTYTDLLKLIQEHCHLRQVGYKIVQSNHEGYIVDAIQNAPEYFDGIVINPAAYTHTSVAILDALKAVGLPAVEIHISNVDSREPFRQISYPGMYCFKTIKGEGVQGYCTAIDALLEYLQNQ
jgi:3-dehydroquinate dehydratase-2